MGREEASAFLSPFPGVWVHGGGRERLAGVRACLWQPAPGLRCAALAGSLGVTAAPGPFGELTKSSTFNMLFPGVLGLKGPLRGCHFRRRDAQDLFYALYLS